jgi:hypothetical protein
MTADDIYYHALLNLFAACLFIAGWWMRSAEEERPSSSKSMKASPALQAPLSAAELAREKAGEVKRSVSSWFEKLTGGPVGGGKGPSSGYHREAEEMRAAPEIQRLYRQGLLGGPLSGGNINGNMPNVDQLFRYGR